MTKDRIAELLSTFVAVNRLSDGQLGAIVRYLDLLVKWNAHVNLTAIREPEEIVTRHFGESLFAAAHLFPDQAMSASATDIGSGAGFPGIPIKIWAQALDMTLVESNRKKATFLREVVRALTLSSVSVLSDRAETLLIPQADLVIFRAVESFELVLRTARRQLGKTGRLAMLIGNSQLEAAYSGLPDMKWDQPVRIPQSQNRILLVGRTSSIA